MKYCMLVFFHVLWAVKNAAGNDVIRYDSEAWDAVSPPAYSPKPVTSYGSPVQWPSPYGSRHSSGESAGTHFQNNVQSSSYLPAFSHYSVNNAPQYSYGNTPTLGTFSAYGISLPPPRGPHMQQLTAGYGSMLPMGPTSPLTMSQANYGCSFTKDDDCFGRARGCAIKHAMPFERRAMLTLENCKTCCLSYVTSYFSCESFVYSSDHSLCDMFAHRGDVTPAILVPTPDHDYYEVISDKCRKSSSQGTPTWTTSKPIRNVSSSTYLDVHTHKCKSNEQLMYYKIIGRQLITKTDPQLFVMSAEQCVESCTANKDNEGRPIVCRSFDFFPSASGCVFHSGGETEEELAENPSAQHFMKTCFPGDLVSHCSNVILREPRKTLIGYARTVVEIKSIKECIEHCLRAPLTYGYTCSSGVFYYEENVLNCIINSETKDQHTDMLLEDRQSNVEYFQLRCGEDNSNSYSVDPILVKPESTGNVYVAEKPLQRISNAVIIAKEIANDWTIWSPCETATNIRKRYQVCDQLDIRNCPQEVEYCKGDTNSVTHPRY